MPGINGVAPDERVSPPQSGRHGSCFNARMPTQLSLSRSLIYDNAVHLCRKYAPLALALISSACSGSGKDCNDNSVWAVRVIVLDGANSTQLDAIAAPEGGAGGESGTRECFAVVTARAGDERETLTCSISNQGSGNDCECQGLGERYGPISVTVELGERVQTQTVEVGRTEDECHPKTETLTFFD